MSILQANFPSSHMMKIKRIYLSKGDVGENADDVENADVIVSMENGEKYIASFFTYDHVNSQRNEKLAKENQAQSKFFWAKSMVIVESCELKMVREIVQYIIDEGDFNEVFRLMSSYPGHEN